MRHPHHHRHHDRHSDIHRFAHAEPGAGRGHRGERGHGRHGHGGPSRLGRFFEHGDMRFVILQLIAERPRHGYELIKAIEEKSGGAYTPSPGVIYPTLTLLEETGHIAITSGDAPRKLHEITDEGRAFLLANKAAVDTIFARIAEATPADGGQPPIMRAMHDLKRALRQRLSAGPLSETQALAIAAKLDAVAADLAKD
jgi:DNA-binding PadR family transcriptional regulator